MALVLEIEFLAGFSAAATGPDNETADWPPAADRVFSALVASWAARGCEKGEAEALRWLERQPPPVVVASVASARTTPVFYVPPNDARLDRAKTAKGVFPALRTRQPRRFAVTRPEEPVVELHWTREPEVGVLEALDRLAADTSYLGASRSLVRCRFRADGGPSAAGRPTARWVYPGRLDELRGAYEARLRPTPAAPSGTASRRAGSRARARARAASTSRARGSRTPASASSAPGGSRACGRC